MQAASAGPEEDPRAPFKLTVRLGQRCSPNSGAWGEFSEPVQLPVGKTSRVVPRALKGEHWPWLQGQSFDDLVVKCVNLASVHVQEDDKASAERALCAAREFSKRGAQETTLCSKVGVFAYHSMPIPFHAIPTVLAVITDTRVCVLHCAGCGCSCGSPGRCGCPSGRCPSGSPRSRRRGRGTEHACGLCSVAVTH